MSLSNPYIKMEKGDIVIFGDTISDGVLTYNKDRDKIYSFNCHDILDYESCYFGELKKKRNHPTLY